MAARPLNPQTAEYWCILIFLVVMTVFDSVLIAILLFNYTETYSLFINQGTAFVYGIAAIPFVVWGARTQARSTAASSNSLEASVSDSAVKAPWYVLVTIGCMNGLANYCFAIGAPHTRGPLQAVITLMAIPLVLGLSWAFLGKRPSRMAASAALLIVVGVGVGSSRSFSESDGAVETYVYSVVIFACAQLFLSGEKVYEEAVFKRYRQLDVMLMFLWTIWTQFMLGWLLLPTQSVPAFGGLELADLPQVMWDGVKCTVGITSQGRGRPECTWLHPFLFFTYCVVDMTCYTWGLYVIQRGGAGLMVLASAIATPLSQFCYALPLTVDGFSERIGLTDVLALVLVLVGFSVYNFCAPEGRADRAGGSLLQK